MPPPTERRTLLSPLRSLSRILAPLTSRRDAARYVVGRAVGLVLAVLGVMVCVISVRQAVFVAGFAGTRGTYTVEECHERYASVGSGRRSSRTVSCTGTFRADRGGTHAHRASDEAHQSNDVDRSDGSDGSDHSSHSDQSGQSGDSARNAPHNRDRPTDVNPFTPFHPDKVYPPGTRVPVQSGDDGTYVVVGREQMWGDAAGVSVSLPLLAAGAFCLLTGFGARWGRSFGDSWDGLPGGTVLRPLLLSVAGVGILGAAVFLFLQHYG
ncbi:hypothetical protein [Streptomyces sp. NPDC052496]|uniref:hypothetical protein n=1 Tax=Streptomyces sp. NPDC052496 TaxID=3154951 RepID=UPI00342CC0EA